MCYLPDSPGMDGFSLTDLDMGVPLFVAVETGVDTRVVVGADTAVLVVVETVAASDVDFVSMRYKTEMPSTILNNIT